MLIANLPASMNTAKKLVASIQKIGVMTRQLQQFEGSISGSGSGGGGGFSAGTKGLLSTPSHLPWAV